LTLQAIVGKFAIRAEHAEPHHRGNLG